MYHDCKGDSQSSFIQQQENMLVIYTQQVGRWEKEQHVTMMMMMMTEETCVHPDLQ